MRHNVLFLSLIYFALSCTLVFSQVSMQKDTVSFNNEVNDIDLKHSISSSLFLLGNIIPEDAVYAFQLDYSYQLTQKDVLIIEGIT